MICIPSAPVQKNASRYIHVFNAKAGDLIHELEFMNQFKCLTPLALKISPDSQKLASFTQEDCMIRIWIIKQSWTSAFRLHPKANLPVKCISTGSEPSANIQAYTLKWDKDATSDQMELLLLHNNCTLFSTVI